MTKRQTTLVKRLSMAAFFVLSFGCAAETLDRPLPAPEAPPQTASANLEDHLFTPADILDRQAALSLTDAQRDAIVEDVRATQSELLTVDARLRAEREDLASLLAGSRVDESDAQRAAATLFATEAQVKALHLALLVRIKNGLSPEQQEQLGALR